MIGFKCRDSDYFFGTVHAGKRPEEIVYYEKQNKILEGSVILFFDNLFYKVIKGV